MRRRCRALISGAGPKVGRRWDGLCVGLRRAVRPFQWTRTPRVHTGLDLAISAMSHFVLNVASSKPIWRVCVHAGFDPTAPIAPRAQSTHPCGSRTARDLVHIKPLRSNGLPNMARGSPKTMKMATIAGLHRPKRALGAPLSAPHARPVAKARPRARQGGRRARGEARGFFVGARRRRRAVPRDAFLARRRGRAVRGGARIDAQAARRRSL